MIEIVKSQRGKPMIYYAGFMYTQHRSDEEKHVFRCKRRDCKSEC
jgi:hypothetical protein